MGKNAQKVLGQEMTKEPEAVLCPNCNRHHWQAACPPVDRLSWNYIQREQVAKKMTLKLMKESGALK